MIKSIDLIYGDLLMKKKHNHNRRKYLILALFLTVIAVIVFAVFVYISLGSLVLCDLNNSHLVCTNYHGEFLGKTPYSPYLTEVKNREIQTAATATQGATLCSQQDDTEKLTTVVVVDNLELHTRPSGLSPIATIVPKDTEIHIVTLSSSVDGVFTWYLVEINNECFWSSEGGIRLLDN